MGSSNIQYVDLEAMAEAVDNTPEDIPQANEEGE